MQWIRPKPCRAHYANYLLTVFSGLCEGGRVYCAPCVFLRIREWNIERDFHNTLSITCVASQRWPGE